MQHAYVSCKSFADVMRCRDRGPPRRAWMKLRRSPRPSPRPKADRVASVGEKPWLLPVDRGPNAW